MGVAGGEYCQLIHCWVRGKFSTDEDDAVMIMLGWGGKERRVDGRAGEGRREGIM